MGGIYGAAVGRGAAARGGGSLDGAPGRTALVAGFNPDNKYIYVYMVYIHMYMCVYIYTHTAPCPAAPPGSSRGCWQEPGLTCHRDLAGVTSRSGIRRGSLTS